MLPPGVTARVSIEAGVTFGWARFVGDRGVSLGVDRYGESAPAKGKAPAGKASQPKK